MIRTSLIPGLLDTLSVNTDQPLPQKIFEVGRITLLDASEEVGAREHLRVAAAIIGSRVDFSDIKATVESLLRDLCFDENAVCEAIEPEHRCSGTYIPGRGAKLGKSGEEWALFGELHPQVLEHFGLGYPVTVLEMSLETLR